jgi:hypothetical protein
MLFNLNHSRFINFVKEQIAHTNAVTRFELWLTGGKFDNIVYYTMYRSLSGIDNEILILNINTIKDIKMFVSLFV